MEFEMKLNSEPFEKIKNKEKTKEVRINDEKRRKIKVGDTIIFSKRPDLNEKIKVKVLSRKEYSKYSPLPKYYTQEEAKKYGVVVFDIELIK